MSLAEMHDASAKTLAVLNGQLVARFYELVRLNTETWRLVFSGAGLHWEKVLRAQTPEQLAVRQAATSPWLAMQFAGYTGGWMEIASEATADFSQRASDRHDGHVRHLETTLDGMARCARGIDAMLRALNLPSVAADSVPVTQPLVDPRNIVRADPDAASASPAAAARRSRSPKLHQSSR